MKYLKYLNERNDIESNKIVDVIFDEIISGIYTLINNLNFYVSEDGKTFVFRLNIEKYGRLDFTIMTTPNENCGFGFSEIYKTPFIAIPSNKLDTSVIEFILLYESGIKHEISHYLDYINSGEKKLGATLYNKENLFNYYNDTKEINAYFIQASNYTLKELKRNPNRFNKYLDSFDKFKEFFLDNLLCYDNIIEFLSEKSKKRLYKRIYLLWQDILGKKV